MPTTHTRWFIYIRTYDECSGLLRSREIVNLLTSEEKY